MKKFYLSVLMVLTTLLVNAQLNTTLRSTLTYGNNALSNIGGYVDSSGNEYALVGYEQGLSIVNVTDPLNPVIAFNVPGTSSIWREVKTWQNYAYVTTEGCCNGLQIINLGYLPDSVVTKTWKGDGPINNQLNTIHSLHIDAGYAYLFGSNISNGAAIIADLSDPWNPTYAGTTPGTYIHDGYVRNDTLYSCHIYDGYFTVMDVTNKSNPVALATQSTPNQFTHNSWLNDAGTALFTTDEVSNSYLASYDITDLGNITELDRLQLTPGSGSIIHNTHTINDYEVISWYKDGIAIVDVARPDNMIVVGSYDTYPQGSGDGFNGCWGVYPYLPSGNLVVSDIDNGLFVITPTYIRGCYLEGLVTDSITGIPLNTVNVEILGPSINKSTKITGLYKTGLVQAGTYDVRFSKSGYITKTITGVILQNGILTNLDVQLASLPTIQVTGQVIEAGTGLPIPNAVIEFKNAQFDNVLTSNASGNFSTSTFYAGTYDITVGHWGHHTYCNTAQNVNGGAPYTIILDKGYYDDFALDFGWTVSGPSPNAWERAVPIATFNGSATANPGSDVIGDCGDLAFVTGTGGGGPWDNDVDQGATILTSPIFDATQYTNPYVNYDRWFYNGGTTNGLPDDTMKISLSNGTQTVELERMYPGTVGNGTWASHSYKISDFLTPTATMRLIVNIADPGPVFNIVEGGLDRFVVTEVTGIKETTSSNTIVLQAYPNPFATDITISYQLTSLSPNTFLTISDISGRVLETKELSSISDKITMGKNWPAGVYLAKIINQQGLQKVVRLNKTN
ncbi:hypothetical protein BH11BAC2_BH11BAC2_13370 [soil metagenome]